MYKATFWVCFFYKLIIFKCLPGFLNPHSTFTAVTKLNVLDRILFYTKPDLRCLRGEGTGPSAKSAHHSQQLSHPVEDLP
jgi:hypothetical protein